MHRGSSNTSQSNILNCVYIELLRADIFYYTLLYYYYCNAFCCTYYYYLSIPLLCGRWWWVLAAHGAVTHNNILYVMWRNSTYMPITINKLKYNITMIFFFYYYCYYIMRQLMRLCYKNDKRIINGYWIFIYV